MSAKWRRSAQWLPAGDLTPYVLALLPPWQSHLLLQVAVKFKFNSNPQGRESGPFSKARWGRLVSCLPGADSHLCWR